MLGRNTSRITLTSRLSTRKMDNGGREALFHHLLNFDLKTVNLRTIPKTTALLDQKLSSLDAEQGWWLDVLSRGELPWGCDQF